MPAKRKDKAPDPAPFLDPIGFIESDHERQQTWCADLDRLVDDIHQIGAPRLAAQLLKHLIEDVPKHVADEEQDLFPLMRQRCLPEDGVDKILDQLSREHHKDDAFAQEVVAGLQRLVADEAMKEPLRFIMRALAFAETTRRHLAWENAVIEPRARRRLTAEDRAELGRKMAARRGIVYPG